MKLVKKVFVPIYSFRFLSSHSDGPCLIFTSIYINYASHYKRGGGNKEKKKHKDAYSPAHRVERRTQKTIRSDIRAITSVPRGLSTSSPYGGRNPTLIPAAFLFCFFFFFRRKFLFLNSHQDYVCVCVWESSPVLFFFAKENFSCKWNPETQKKKNKKRRFFLGIAGVLDREIVTDGIIRRYFQGEQKKKIINKINKIQILTYRWWRIDQPNGRSSLLFQRGADAIFDDGVYYHVSTFCSRLKKKTHISATHFTQFTNTKWGKKKNKKNQNVHKSLDGSSLARQTPTHTAKTENNQKI